MAETSLRSEQLDGIRTLTMARPEALNALDRALKTDLLAAFRGAARDAAVRAVVLTGDGRAFCAGQDLREAGVSGAAIGREIRERYVPLVLAIARLEKPVVAAVNGVAAGAGLALALACDVRLASSAASFACAFGRVGLVPDSGVSWFLPRLVGPAWAAELVLGGESLEAEAAARIGLVQRVVPPDELLPEAHALALRFARGAPLAAGLAKRALAAAQESSLEAALEYEAQLQSVAGRSADHAEGRAAFLEKRPPRFRGA